MRDGVTGHGSPSVEASRPPSARHGTVARRNAGLQVAVRAQVQEGAAAVRTRSGVGRSDPGTTPGALERPRAVDVDGRSHGDASRRPTRSSIPPQSGQVAR